MIHYCDHLLSIICIVVKQKGIDRKNLPTDQYYSVQCMLMYTSA